MPRMMEEKTRGTTIYLQKAEEYVSREG